jgi:hypothetical protein
VEVVVGQTKLPLPQRVAQLHYPEAQILAAVAAVVLQVAALDKQEAQGLWLFPTQATTEIYSLLARA